MGHDVLTCHEVCCIRAWTPAHARHEPHSRALAMCGRSPIGDCLPRCIVMREIAAHIPSPPPFSQTHANKYHGHAGNIMAHRWGQPHDMPCQEGRRVLPGRCTGHGPWYCGLTCAPLLSSSVPWSLPSRRLRLVSLSRL